MITHRELFLKNVAQTSDFPLALEIEQAEGVYMYGKNGQQYMDLISGIGVSNVGHRHPKVVEAIKNQVDKYLHLMVYGEYVQTPQVELAEALVKTLTPTESNVKPLDNVYFTNSGTEAVEGAMKLAKRFTGRQEIISCFNAYHGATQGALSLSGSENFKRNFRPLLPSIRNIRHGVIEDIALITEKTAAVIIEIVGGEAGVRIPEKEYFLALRKRCEETRTLLILDEIQTGFGRTGTFWAFQQFGIYPDILLCAKGMGGGMPIGAFIANHEVMGVFKNNPILGHITTFGGHPVSCASSLATLNVILEENLLASVQVKATLFKSLLVHEKIKEVRNQGLMMAVEFEDFDTLKPIIDRAIEKGIITDWFLFCDNSMRIAPPLIITEEQIRKACAVILESI
ncbi:acetylornithine/succinyldiaminopimelate/putrescine aminotransferase [Arcicella sp. BE140]|nr:acetylornithine/succinyldiaminopimelate/putrescine aminotransferase [Arcicella sp. BE51]MDR6813956.1 acetylornithine/succinyldiaminopimelate/putrescine aminotransferase [Arcicella sp. BE140]MDR6825337.1 acetylornithine/succinyldiaminopimelate/putrescine aminotransferase [Arcicella sp. BE139]